MNESSERWNLKDLQIYSLNKKESCKPKLWLSNHYSMNCLKDKPLLPDLLYFKIYQSNSFCSGCIFALHYLAIIWVLIRKFILFNFSNVEDISIEANASSFLLTRLSISWASLLHLAGEAILSHREWLGRVSALHKPNASGDCYKIGRRGAILLFKVVNPKKFIVPKENH